MKVSSALGLYFLLGSVVGLYASFQAVHAAWHYPSLVWVGAFFFGLYLALGLTGYSLLRTGRVSLVTMALQALQLVGFSAFGFKYQFCAGASLKVGFQGHTLLYILEPINVEFTLGKNPTVTFGYVNLVPLLLLAVLTHNFRSADKLAVG